MGENIVPRKRRAPLSLEKVTQTSFPTERRASSTSRSAHGGGWVPVSGGVGPYRGGCTPLALSPSPTSPPQTPLSRLTRYGLRQSMSRQSAESGAIYRAPSISFVVRSRRRAPRGFQRPPGMVRLHQRPPWRIGAPGRAENYWPWLCADRGRRGEVPWWGRPGSPYWTRAQAPDSVRRVSQWSVCADPCPPRPCRSTSASPRVTIDSRTAQGPPRLGGGLLSRSPGTGSTGARGSRRSTLPCPYYPSCTWPACSLSASPSAPPPPTRPFLRCGFPAHSWYSGRGRAGC